MFKRNYKDWITSDSFFIFYFSYCLLVLEYPIDIWANMTIIHYQHWSRIILINILITPLETSYALWVAKMDLFTVMPILRYCQRKCVFTVEMKNNENDGRLTWSMFNTNFATQLMEQSMSDQFLSRLIEGYVLIQKERYSEASDHFNRMLYSPHNPMMMTSFG